MIDPLKYQLAVDEPDDDTVSATNLRHALRVLVDKVNEIAAAVNGLQGALTMTTVVTPDAPEAPADMVDAPPSVDAAPAVAAAVRTRIRTQGAA